MMNQTPNFTQIARWQQSAFRNRPLMRILTESAQEVLTGQATPLALAFHEASVAAVYQQFGFIVFAPESRRLLSICLSRQTRMSYRLLVDWLEQAAYQQLADFHVLRYLDSEPNWLNLSQEFCTAVVKRIVVCRPEEWDTIGLEHYPEELLQHLMRVIDSQMMAMRQGVEIHSGRESLRKLSGEHQNGPELQDVAFDLWGNSIDYVLGQVAQDPLRLLAWRLEAFSTERQLLRDARLAVASVTTDELERRALSVIALMVLLAGFEIAGEGVIISETPVTFSSLCKSIANLPSSANQHTQVITGLLGLSETSGTCSQILNEVLLVGEQLGVFHWAAVAKGQKGVLLTSLAFLILEPYRNLIESNFGVDSKVDSQ